MADVAQSQIEEALKTYIDPYLEADLIVEDKYNLRLKGFLENNHLDMDYRLTSNCIQSNVCTIDDEINISGHINGPLGNAQVTGKGKALDGNVSYEWLRYEDTFKDIDLVLNDVNSISNSSGT
mgnify:CR=1 FL=1